MKLQWIFKHILCCPLPTGAALLLACAFGGAAQEQVTKATPTPDIASGKMSLRRADEQYRIGPGDLLDIRVISRPQLSRDSVRVDRRGTILMPWIERGIPAICRTERELADEIASLYRRYQRNPQVDVFVKEYQSKPVAALGAVNTPGRFQLQRPVRLLELLSLVNGPSDKAGRTLQIIHAGDEPPCAAAGTVTTDVATVESPLAAAPPRDTTADEAADEDDESVTTLELEKVLRSATGANPFMRPGDVVTVFEAGQIFVIGNVMNPTPLRVKGTLTVSQAVAMAGGLAPDARSERVRIVRQTPSGKEQIFANLKAIDNRQAEDVALQANDIVDVPSSMTGAKKVFSRILSGFFGTVSRLPVQVITPALPK